MLRWPAVVVLGCVSLVSGALLPWIMPAQSNGGLAAPAEAAPPITRPGPLVAAAPADVAEPQGVIAIGDAVMLAARPCLEQRGIQVHPRALSSADELLSTAQRVADDYAAIFVHAGHGQGLVDGQIDRVIKAVGPRSRIVWSTIRVAGAPWGDYSFEERTNASIRNVVGRHDQGRVLDWDALTRKHPQWTVSGNTLSAEGCRDYARKVASLSGLPRDT